MLGSFQQHLTKQLDEIRQAGLYKQERVITSPQDARIRVGDGQTVLNLCANNYLGLAEHPAVVKAAHEALDQWGYGLSSVRFICGTQSIHKQLEANIIEFLGTEDTILYSSCFDANGGLFETLLGPEDAVISDELNHAGIIDGVRLCKARRLRYLNNNMEDLEAKLREAQDVRFRMIATDGVFSMDGHITNLAAICDFAEKYDAQVMVDDSHAVGFMGKRGRICFPTPWRLRLSRRRSKCSSCSPNPQPCATSWRATQSFSAMAWRDSGSTSCPACIRSCRSCWETPRWRRKWPRRC